MTVAEITRRRLRSQYLIGKTAESPEDVVRQLCAVQAQDFAGAKWAIAQRSSSVTDGEIERLFNAGKILRTHVLRPTWHFVMPEDIRWLIALTAPRVNAFNAYQYRQCKLDEGVFPKAHAALIKELRGGVNLTREEISRVYERAGIPARGLRLAYLVMRAELDAIICSGPLRGRQFTYALLEERVPKAKGKAFDRDEALAELAARYFESHGPALVSDLAWWAGLTLKTAQSAVELAAARLSCDKVDGKVVWFSNAIKPGRMAAPVVHLLPNYDEYFACKHRDFSFDPSTLRSGRSPASALQRNIVVLNGWVIGGWNRTIQKGDVYLTTDLLKDLDQSESSALAKAAAEYGRFLGMPVTLLQKPAHSSRRTR